MNFMVVSVSHDSAQRGTSSHTYIMKCSEQGARFDFCFLVDLIPLKDFTFLSTHRESVLMIVWVKGTWQKAGGSKHSVKDLWSKLHFPLDDVHSIFFSISNGYTPLRLRPGARPTIQGFTSTSYFPVRKKHQEKPSKAEGSKELFFFLSTSCFYAFYSESETCKTARVDGGV